VIRYTTHKPLILFAGINPHPGSYRRGVPFSNNKMFWYLLSRAGLIEESIDELRDDATLQAVYKEKFNAVYGLGFLNIINRPTRDITLLRKGEERTGRARIARTIKAEKPKVVCFVGKVAYEKFIGHKKFDFGWQPDVGSSKAFVMHFPLRGEAIVRVRELMLVAQVAKE
jgi:TDG/mug DNA glycosylase family protein